MQINNEKSFVSYALHTYFEPLQGHHLMCIIQLALPRITAELVGTKWCTPAETGTECITHERPKCYRLNCLIPVPVNGICQRQKLLEAE